MKRVLVNDGRSMRLVHLPGEHGVFEFLEYNSADDARHYLERFAHDTGSVVQLRRALAEDSYGLDVPRMTDDEVFDEMSWRVVHRQFGIAEEIPDPPVVIAEPQEASSSSSEPPPLPKPTRKLTYIEFQVIWDGNGKPVKNVRLVVRTPDGVENFHDTNGEGKVRIEDLEEGKCDVRCDTKELRLPQTLAFVAMGPGGGGASEAPPNSSSTVRIAKIEAHKVKSSESLASLASKAGMKWQDLAKFNWNTDVPAQINENLASKVGCTKKTKDGNNYMFDDSDEPGLVFIPTRWEEQGLATGQQHVLRVKALALGDLVGPQIDMQEQEQEQIEEEPPAPAPTDDAVDDEPTDETSTAVADDDESVSMDAGPPDDTSTAEEEPVATEPAAKEPSGTKSKSDDKDVGPVVKGAPAFVVVSKPWMKIGRKPLVLKTDSSFDGTGTLAITGTAIKFYDAAKDGNEITSSAGNTFPGKKLGSGVKIYAQGVSASAAVDDVILKLTLAGGTKAVKAPAEVKLTAIEVVLDICGERKTVGVDPDPMDQPPDTAPGKDAEPTDKFYGGRYIQVQDADKNCGRAMLIVRQVKPAGFTGTLVLKTVNSKVKIFAKEDPKDAAGSIKLPKELKPADFAAGDVKFWVQGASNSGSLRDSGLVLDVKDLAKGVDQVKITVVKFFKIKATIKSTPANTVRAGIDAPKDHKFETNKLTDDFADAKNKPLVLMRSAQPDIALEVTVKPKGLPILWKAVRNSKDHASLGKDTDVPTLTPDATKKTKCELSCDNKGSFRIRPYIDTNGDDKYNEKEPSMPLNLVLADATVVADNSAGITGNLTSTLPAGFVSIRNGTWPGTWAAATGVGGAGMTMELVADVTGGGADGQLGLNKVFGGLVNMLTGNEITLTYQSQAAPVTTHTIRNRYVLNRKKATGRYSSSAPDPKDLFQPGHTAPDLLNFPVLDTGRDPGGIGAETAVMGRSGVWDPAPTPQAVGSRYTLRCIDSPGRGFDYQHPDHATEFLVTIHYVQQFRANFCFWTNINRTRAKSGHTAERVYCVLRHMGWEAVGDWTVAWAGAVPTLTNTNPHVINVTSPTTVSPIGRAQDNGVEVRPPSGITKAIAWETD